MVGFLLESRSSHEIHVTTNKNRVMIDQRTTAKEGVVIEYNGKYWGVVYDDGQCHAVGWVKLEKAGIHDPRFLTKPEDATYNGSPDIKELQKGRLIPIKRTIQITDELG